MKPLVRLRLAAQELVGQCTLFTGDISAHGRVDAGVVIWFKVAWAGMTGNSPR
jgi:hypothetical protein